MVKRESNTKKAGASSKSKKSGAPKKAAASPAKKSAKAKSAKKAAKTEVTASYEGSAMLRHVRIPARKARLVVDLIRGKQVDQALRTLTFNTTKGARLVKKLLQSAIANARENNSVDVDRLWVSGGWVNEGRTMKRYMPRARGSASTIRKRSSHITLRLAEMDL